MLLERISLFLTLMQVFVVILPPAFDEVTRKVTIVLPALLGSA